MNTTADNINAEELGEDLNRFAEAERAAYAEEKTIFQKLMTARTGEGTVEDYLHSPLNFNNSLAVARIVRGLTGLLGNLDLAIIDIAIGIIEHLTPIKEEEPPYQQGIENDNV